MPSAWSNLRRSRSFRGSWSRGRSGMRATPYNSISEPCDEPGIGSPVQKSTPQSTTLGRRLLNDVRNSSRPRGGWTTELTEGFVQLCKEGKHSFGQIGKLIGKTRNACIGKANRLGLEPRSPRNWSFYDPNWKPKVHRPRK